jgi:DNA-binding transcriptional LysR family regulator
LSQFTRQYPDISLLFDSQNSVAKLWERNYDLAIRPSNKPPEQMLGSLIMTLEHQVMAQPCQLQSGQLIETQLKPDCYWLLLGGEIANHPTVKWWRENFKAAGGESKVIYYDSMLQIRNAVLAGQGVGCLPKLPDRPITDQSQTLQALGQYGQFCPTEIWALYHPTNRQNPKIRAFIDFLKGLTKS